MKKYTELLNTAHSSWMRALEANSDEAIEHRMNFIHLLEEVKAQHTDFVQIDFSMISDFGEYQCLEMDEMVLALTKIRLEKNNRIDEKKYQAALELEKLEHSLRCEINKEMCRKLFRNAETFHSISSTKIGFIYSGNHEKDMLLNVVLKLVYKRIIVNAKQLLQIVEARQRLISPGKNQADNDPDALKNAA